MNPYRTPGKIPSNEKAEPPPRPKVLDMVRILKLPAYYPTARDLYGLERRVGQVGFVSLISDHIFLVTFIKNGKTTCSFFTEDEIEVVKRYK